LPFLLAVVLAQVSSLSEFFEALAEVRDQAEPLRRHRAELDGALRVGDTNVARQLQLAFERDAEDLRRRFPYAPVAGGVAAALAAFSSSSPYLVLATIGVLTMGSLMPAHFLERLQTRAFRPQFWVLSSMKDTTAAMTNVLPRVKQLWSEPTVVETGVFTERFKRLQELHYA
jgi:hypothetical protein